MESNIIIYLGESEQIIDQINNIHVEEYFVQNNVLHELDPRAAHIASDPGIRETPDVKTIPQLLIEFQQENRSKMKYIKFKVSYFS